MNFSVYKIIEKINGYYYYFISHIDHLDLNFNVAESWADAMPDIPINNYFNTVMGWSDDVDIEKCDDISPIQVINKQFPTNDVKNMNISNDFEKVLNEALEALKNKKKRTAKPKADKPEPKPKGKAGKKQASKNNVTIEKPNESLKFD